MILITSGAYIGQELKSIFGKLIPTFLPVKNKRLYFHQANIFPTKEEKYISIPHDFEMEKADTDLLKKLNLKIIKVPGGLSLGESVVYCLNWIGCYHQSLTILHGDTLIYDIPDETSDFFSVGRVIDNYDWAQTKSLQDEDLTYTGLFHFNDIALLVRCFLESKNDFIDGIEKYKEKSQKIKLIPTEKWFDFGHSNTYFRSRSKLTTERSFNQITSNNGFLTKSSTQVNKIRAEYKWFFEIPEELQIFTPRCISFNENDRSASYKLEYIFQPTLNELFVYGDIPVYVWMKIINSCIQLLEKFSQYKSLLDISEVAADLFYKKTIDRLQEFEKNNRINIKQEWTINGIRTPSLLSITEVLSKTIDTKDRSFQTISHGDFCFSNILYDFRAQSIRVIDPRGVDARGTITLYSDIRYDIAKLTHSIIGLYDFIIADNFELQLNANNSAIFRIPISAKIQEIQSYYLNCLFNEQKVKNLQSIPMTILLFLSMLPLHNENPLRQKALMLNALRLFNEYQEYL